MTKKHGSHHDLIKQSYRESVSLLLSSLQVLKDDRTAGKAAMEWVTSTCAAEARILIVAGAESPQASAHKTNLPPDRRL